MSGQDLKNALAGLGVLLLIGIVGFLAAHCLIGCASRDAAAAEAAYTADHLRCVDKATTLAESKACRADVDRRYGIVQTTKDGGAR